MRIRVLSSRLSLILNCNLLLLFFLKQSYASHQLENEDFLQLQSVSKTVIVKPEEREASYGNFDMLSEDILFHHILPHCDHDIIKINRFFFTLVTGYSFEHIFDQGFENRPTRPVCYIMSNADLNFKNHVHNIEHIPSFVWYSLIRKVEDISPAYWSYLKGSNIQIINLHGNQIMGENIRRLAQNLKFKRLI